ncbi:DnaJ subfamily C member 2 [Blattella germanica]|nr:DnaJ subfamily C member 2 [Blattella germanica]
MKLQRETLKRALKKARSALRKLVKENNYFSLDSSDIVSNMTSLEKICESWKLEEIEELTAALVTEGRAAFLSAVKETDRRMEVERQDLIASAVRGTGNDDKKEKKLDTWTQEQLQLLIKALNLFPAGTNQRWEAVASFINQHSTGGNVRTAKEVLAKTKDLQSSDYSQNIHK